MPRLQIRDKPFALWVPLLHALPFPQLTLKGIRQQILEVDVAGVTLELNATMQLPVMQAPKTREPL